MSVRTCIFLLIFASLVMPACTVVTPPPSRFPQLNERAISDVGKYSLPRWSRDGKYIAYVNWDTRTLFVYEIATGKRSAVANEVDRYFSWDAEGSLSYVRYRPELSGSPFPAVYDLHVVGANGGNDTAVVHRLYDPMSIVWFTGGQQFIAVAALGETREADRNILLVSIQDDTRIPLITRQQLGVEEITGVSLTSDEKLLAISGTRQMNDGKRIVLIIYDLAARAVLQEIIPSQVFPHTYIVNGDVGWIQGHSWLVSYGATSQGACARNALLFFNTVSSSNSFCIPTSGDSIGYAEVSPAATQLVFLTPVTPGTNYVMIADLTPEYRARLK
jgi:hypothetical protein